MNTLAMRYHKKMAISYIEIVQPRTEMLGLRITKDELKLLKAIAKKLGGTPTQVAYALLKKKLLEQNFL